MARGMGLAGILYNVANNYDPWTKRKIYDENDPPSIKKEKIAHYVMLSFGPGGLRHIENLWRAAKGEVVGWPLPNERDLTLAALRTIGISIYPGGYNEAMAKILQYQNEMRDTQMTMVRVLRNPNISEEAKQRVIAETIAEIQIKEQEIQKILENFPQIKKELQEKEEKGKIIPWKEYFKTTPPTIPQGRILNWEEVFGK
jgi:hypothetical protein